MRSLTIDSVNRHLEGILSTIDSPVVQNWNEQNLAGVPKERLVSVRLVAKRFSAGPAYSG